MKSKNVFPKDFLWGASISSHQVEGGNHNQWTVWELSHAAELARSAARRLSWLPNWLDIRHQAEDPNNYVSGRGIDHYRRYQEDFDIAKSLNFNSMRIGIEWSRLQPSQNEWDQEAIGHYREYIQSLRTRGIEPVLNIWHDSLPVWFTDLGAFKYRKNLKYFYSYVAKLSDEFGKDLKWVITLNEVNAYTLYGYLLGEPVTGLRWPPEEKNLLSATRVYLNLITAHKKSYRLLKRAHPHLQVGIAMHWANIQAQSSRNFIDSGATKFMRYAWNNWFLLRTKRQHDFIGINYYFTDYYSGLLKRDNPSVPVSDLGWYMEPEGLYPLLLRAHKRFKKPVIITETGVADSKDQYRRWWLEETIVAMERAISRGVDIRGFFVWSLLDNFEWAYGWWPKFGLVEVDRQNGMKRQIRDSAKWYAEQIKKLS